MSEAQQLMFNLTCGQIPGGISSPCAMCKDMTAEGVCCHLVGTVHAQVICFQCLADRLYKYQQMNPDKSILDVDLNIEGPELQSRFLKAINRVMEKYNVSSSDADALTTALLEALDEGKF
jgi:hypothetical protein